MPCHCEEPRWCDVMPVLHVIARSPLGRRGNQQCGLLRCARNDTSFAYDDKRSTCNGIAFYDGLLCLIQFYAWTLERLRLKPV